MALVQTAHHVYKMAVGNVIVAIIATNYMFRNACANVLVKMGLVHKVNYAHAMVPRIA